MMVMLCIAYTQVMQTISTDFDRIFKIHDKCYVGLPGLGTDTQTVYVLG